MTHRKREGFRATEYAAPLILVVLIALGVGWLMMRLWRKSLAAPPEPRPAPTDYRLTLPRK